MITKIFKYYITDIEHFLLIKTKSEIDFIYIYIYIYSWIWFKYCIREKLIVTKRCWLGDYVILTIIKKQENQKVYYFINLFHPFVGIFRWIKKFSSFNR